MTNSFSPLIQKLLKIPKIASLMSAPLRSELAHGAGDTEALKKLITELENIVPKLKVQGKTLSGKIRHDLTELETAVDELKKNLGSVKARAKNIEHDLDQVDMEMKALED